MVAGWFADHVAAPDRGEADAAGAAGAAVTVPAALHPGGLQRGAAAPRHRPVERQRGARRVGGCRGRRPRGDVLGGRPLRLRGDAEGHRRRRPVTADRGDEVTDDTEALGLGQLTLPEYEERSHQAVAARTFADLDRLVADLPAVQNLPPSAAPAYRAPSTAPAGVARLGETKWAVMSETKVRGPVAVGAVVVAVVAAVATAARTTRPAP